MTLRDLEAVVVVHKIEEAEGEGAELELESRLAEAGEAAEEGLGRALRALPCRPGGHFVPRILAGVPPPAIQGDDLVLVDGRLAHGAGLVVGAHLQPLVQAGPAEQMSTDGDDCIGCRIKANVAFKIGILLFVFFLLSIFLLFTVFIVRIFLILIVRQGFSFTCHV